MYLNKPFKFFENDSCVHVSFKIGNKIYSFELNSYSTDYVSMAIWDSEEEYLESFKELTD